METINIFTPGQIRDLEKFAIHELGISEEILMENAAHELFNIIEKNFPNYSIKIICGPGNNGGDGYALARILYSKNYSIEIHELKESKKYSYIPRVDLSNVEISSKDLIIDSMFGIGLNRKLDENNRKLIDQINKSNAKVISVDIPTGIDSTTGEIIGDIAFKADITVTFFGYKVGLLKKTGTIFSGKIYCTNLTVPEDYIRSFSKTYINKPEKIKIKSRYSHKKSSGISLIIAGSENYYGAPILTTKAAIKSGCSYLLLSAPNEIKKIIATVAPEVIFIERENLYTYLSPHSVIAVGPGLGVSKESEDVIKKILSVKCKAIVIDADGLNNIATNSSLTIKTKTPLILTPHPGEMARLLNKSVQEVESNREESAKLLSAKYNAIVIYKGVNTVISDTEGNIFINNISSQTLATAGTGDILTGIITALLMDNEPLEAVKTAVYIHGECGLNGENRIGKIGVSVSDIIDFIPEVMNKYIMENHL